MVGGVEELVTFYFIVEKSHCLKEIVKTVTATVFYWT